MDATAGRVAAIGEWTLVRGYGLAGVQVAGASGDEEVRRAWEALGDDVRIVILTPRAARCLGAAGDGTDRMCAVIGVGGAA